MPKNVRMVLVAAIIAGIGFAGGMIVQRSFFGPRQMIRDRAAGEEAEQDTKAPAGKSPGRDGSVEDFEKLVAAWTYPNAKIQQGARGGELSYSVSTTADSVTQVCKHYEKLLGFKKSFTAEGASGGASGDSEATIVSASDSLTPDQKTRGVRAAFASRRAKGYVVTIHVSQGESEKHTHVVLVFAQR